MKHGGGSVMLWCCFSPGGPGARVKIHGKMKTSCPLSEKNLKTKISNRDMTSEKENQSPGSSHVNPIKTSGITEKSHTEENTAHTAKK